MCTRYYMDDAPKEYAELFEAALRSALADRFIKEFGRPIVTKGEVRPTDITPVIAPNKQGIKTVYPMRWGFYNPAHKTQVFNARTETAGTKPTFKDSWQSRRCIIPASHYFEWEHFKSADGKQKTGDKYAIQPVNATLTYLCGLYRIENGFPTFVILTREPSAELSTIHDRMPLILPADLIDKWILPESDPNALLDYALTEMVFEKTE